MGFKEFWLNKNQLLQVAFILIILYAISSVNVLILALNILPYLPNAFLKPYTLIGFALIAFILACFMGIYHLSSMLRRRKRKTDIHDHESVNAKWHHVWERAHYVSKTIFVLLIIYCVFAINVLLLALDVVRYIQGAYNSPYLYIVFAMISFLLTVLICAYHLSTLIRRRKRSTDRLSEKNG